MKITKWGIAKQAMKMGMFFSAAFAAVQGYKIWVYFQKFPEVYFEYKLGYSLPQEALIKIQMIQTGKSMVLLGLFFYILFEICSYLENKEKHWLWKLNNRFKLTNKLEKLGGKLKDD